MSERDEVLEALGQAGVLSALRWAFGSAAARALEDYSEDAGHDAAWFGYTRFKLFCDRLDRVFSCGRYAVPDDVDGRASLDIVRAELSQADVETMPGVMPRTIVRHDLNQSPGWVAEDVRLLLHSITPGKRSEDLTWPLGRPTKREVAQQPSADVAQQTLFESLGEEEVDGHALLDRTDSLDLRTLVVAHGLHPMTGARELVLGHPRLNDAGGRPWHWTHDLLPTRPGDGEHLRPTSPGPAQRQDVPDAPVKLRRRASESGSEAAAR